MRRLNENLPRRILLIVAVALGVAYLMSGLDLTTWAIQVNQSADINPQQEPETLAPPLMYVLPFIKVLLFTCIPMALTIGLHRLVVKQT